MKRKKVVAVPKPENEVPPGFYMVKVGQSRVVFDAYGQAKPPAEVRTMKRRNKAGGKRKGPA